MSVIFTKDKEDREPSDARILGSGEFVSMTLQRTEGNLAKKYLHKRSMEDLMEMAAKRSGLAPNLIRSGSRRKQCTRARALFAWLAVEEDGYAAAAVGRFLGISRVGVKKALERQAENGATGNFQVIS